MCGNENFNYYYYGLVSSTLIQHFYLSLILHYQWKCLHSEKSKWHLNITLKIVFTLQIPKRVSVSKGHTLKSTTLRKDRLNLDYKTGVREKEREKFDFWLILSRNHYHFLPKLIHGRTKINLNTFSMRWSPTFINVYEISNILTSANYQDFFLNLKFL